MKLEGDKRILVIALLTSLTVSLVINLLYVYGGQLCGSGSDRCPIFIQEDTEAIRGPVAPPPGKQVAVPGKPAPAKPGVTPLPEKPGAAPAPGPQNRRRGEGGGFGMRLPSATPELLALYKARATLNEKFAASVIQDEKTAGAGTSSLAVLNACLARDKAKLAYWRREADLRPAAGAAEAFLQYKYTERFRNYSENLYKAGALQLDKLNLSQLDLIDAQIQLEEALLRVRDKAAWDKAAKTLENYPYGATDEQLRALLAAEQTQAPR